MFDPTQRYDRQIRLWGSHGQARLVSSKILVFGSCPATSETLKNLVLPGIGEVVVIDDATVTERDIHRDFFLHQTDIGSSRADSICKHLSKINDSVSFTSLHQDPNTVSRSVNFIEKHKPSIVLGITLTVTSSSICFKLCNQSSIPFLTLSIIGPFFSLRLFAGLYGSIETHFDPIFDPLLNSPPKKVTELVSVFHNNGFGDHIPWPVMCLAAIDHLKSKGEIGSTVSKQDMGKVKLILKDWKGKRFDIESIVECESNLYTAFSSLDVPPSVDECFRIVQSKAIPEGQKSDHFWSLMTCLFEFYTRHSRLPHNGFVPDMDSDPQSYGIIRQSYRLAFEKDIECLKDIYQEKIGSINNGIESEIVRLCKNSRTIHISQYPLSFLPFDTLKQEIIDNPNQESLATFIFPLTIAFLRFKEAHGRFPLNNIDDRQALQLLLDHLETEIGVEKYFDSATGHDLIDEMIRSKDALLHCICSISGSITAQEVIKVVTKQFTPISNTFIWNGIKGFGDVLKL
ncbi:hypothetical protein P9112_009254 [Eukaryota sp. TZLM1-RC]